MTDADIKKTVRYWTGFLAGKSWRDLTHGSDPKSVGCGEVYELPQHSRPGEEICIADMRHLAISEPHYHPDNNVEIYVEIYIVMAGTANLVVGSVETPVKAGLALVIPPNHVHYAVPDENFVTAAVNIPGYTDENYIVTTKTDPRVKFDL